MAGVALAGTFALESSNGILPVAATGLAMMALYAFGITLNDWVDREKDATSHPDRPLPSGDVSLTTARGVMIGTVAMALGLLTYSGALWTGLGVLVAIVLYDAVLPDRSLGSTLSMGTCRALCMLSGYVATTDAAFTTDALLAGASYVVLVACLTLLSTLEDGGATPWRLLLAGGGIAAALFAPCFMTPPVTVLPVWATAIAALCVAWWDLHPLFTSPRRYGLAVRNTVFGLPFFCALVCLGAGQPGWAIGAAAVFPLVRLAARVIGQRGS